MIGRRGGTRGVARRALYSALVVLLLGSAPLAVASAQQPTVLDSLPPFDVPAWAFPMLAGPPAARSAAEDSMRVRVPLSRASYLRAETRDRYAVPDWFPARHPAMPEAVARGRKPAVMACAFCHLPDGSGRPENATLAGLSPAYMAAKLAEMRARERKSVPKAGWLPLDLMTAIADSMTDAETTTALEYFSKLRPRRRSEVREARTVPRTLPFVGIYVRDPAGGSEPLAGRLIEFPESTERHELRDPTVRYLAYVPVGSLARGRRLSAIGKDIRMFACTACHGSRLRGTELAPPIAGRSPSYLLRQLIAFRTGARSGESAVAMRLVATTLSLDDMVAAAAYAATLTP